MDKFAKQAFDEYNSATETVRRAGNNGKPFWNMNSSQFMYVPQFMMPAIPGAKEYIYTATDSKGDVHTFTAESPIEPLNEIWKDIAVGIVTLTVEVMGTMLSLYRVTGDELLLEKAKALSDSITRMQDPEIGVIPTHWMSKDCTKTLENFWINCHIGSAFRMFELAKEVGEI